jgi:uncharacterized repeat protein (TIGR01451 family)
MQKRIALLSITFAFAILFFSGAASAANPNTAITVGVNNTNLYANTTFNYTTTVTNAKPTGTVNATQVNVKENIPTGFNTDSYSASTGTFNTTSNIWSIGTVQPGDIDTLNLMLTPTTADDFQHFSATLYQAQTPTAINSNTVTPFVNQANVSLSPIFVSTTTANVGSYFYKLLTVTNNGPEAALGLVITDPVPSTLNVINAFASLGTYTTTFNSITGTLFTWTIPFLAAGHSATLQLGLEPNAFAAGTTVNNNATLTNTYQTVYAPGVYVPLANVKVTKTVSTGAPVATQPFTYTVTAANSGPDNATTVSVVDYLSNALTYVSSSVSQGTVALTGTLPGINVYTWTVGTIANGANAVWNMTVIAPTSQLGKAITNLAVEHQDQYSTVSGIASASVNVVPTSLAITKTVSNTTPTVTTPFSYTTTVTDNGALPVSNVLVNDPRYLPGSSGKVSYTGYTASTGTTYNPTTGLWTIPTLAVGASDWLTLDYTPTDDASGFNFTDTATLIKATVTNTVTHVSTTYPYQLTASATASVVPVPPKPVAPFVISTGPANGGSSSLNPIISINFNELIALGTGNIQIKTTNAPGTAVPYTLNINGSILTLTPTTALTDDTWYTVIIHSGSVVGQNGSAPIAVPYTFRFFAT